MNGLSELRVYLLFLDILNRFAEGGIINGSDARDWAVTFWHSSAGVAVIDSCRALLGWTGEGTCPYVI
jgi:hypothetical protein